MPGPEAAQLKSQAYLRYQQAIVHSVTERLAAAEAAGVRPEDLGDPESLARRAGAVIPLRHAFDDIAGPFYDTAGVAEWLSMSRQAVHKAVRAGRLLGCRTRDGHIVYPAWQFTDDAQAIPHLAAALAALDAPSDPWRAALWLAAPAPYLPDGVSAASWLAGGGDPHPVLAAARSDAARWAA